MSVFERIVCGIDGSAEAIEALRQARRLLVPSGLLIAATAFDPAQAMHTGWDAGAVLVDLEREAHSARAQAEHEIAELEHAETRILEGGPLAQLVRLAREERATLIAVGSHGWSRTAGILLGSVATGLAHEAPCPVLVARRAGDIDAFPQTIVVGADGSPQSLAAVEAAREVAERLGAAVRVIAARGGKRMKAEGVAAIERLESIALSGRGARPPATVASIEWSAESPVDALVAASDDADLLVLGSRGVHGIAALGSVSERVVHRARCSVLVVRNEAS
ncbi:MAG TPA: universal stress protein [Gaiellaceae bacterium]|nr:universal stress protein [Gaiellaceae bacterium]